MLKLALKNTNYVGLIAMIVAWLIIVAGNKRLHPYTFDEPELIELVKYGALSKCNGKIGSGARTCNMTYSELFRNEQKIFTHLESHGWVRTYLYEETYENINSDAFKKGLQLILMKDDIFKYRSGTNTP